MKVLQSVGVAILTTMLVSPIYADDDADRGQNTECTDAAFNLFDPFEC